MSIDRWSQICDTTSYFEDGDRDVRPLLTAAYAATSTSSPLAHPARLMSLACFMCYSSWSIIHLCMFLFICCLSASSSSAILYKKGWRHIKSFCTVLCLQPLLLHRWCSILFTDVRCQLSNVDAAVPDFSSFLCTLEPLVFLGISHQSWS